MEAYEMLSTATNDRHKTEALMDLSSQHNLRMDAVRAVLPSMPQGRRLIGPLVGVRDYRGKRQMVVGYRWTRLYAHQYNGLVHDCILGWGETFDDALTKMRQKVSSLVLAQLDAPNLAYRSGDKD